jgi:hypothetical protein
MCFWNNGNFDVAQKPMYYGAEMAKLVHRVKLMRMEDIEVARLIQSLTRHCTLYLIW